MKLKKIPFKNIIGFERLKEYDNIYDVSLIQSENIKKFKSIEVSLFLYPFSRKVFSKNIKFNPFEEYVKDILSDQRSAYFKIGNNLNNLFGIFLGLLITIVFYYFKPNELLSIESIVSVFGSYIIGKELWNDIEKFLINVSKSWRIQFEENRYAYRLDKNTMMTHYTLLAKKERYGIMPVMPQKIHFINQSNSQTVRLFIKTNDIIQSKSKNSHLLSIRVDSEKMEQFEKDGYMMTVRMKFNKKILWWTKTWEFFNSINKGEIGCLDQHGRWTKNAVLVRRINSCRRLSLLLKSKLRKNCSLIKIC